MIDTTRSRVAIVASLFMAGTPLYGTNLDVTVRRTLSPRAAGPPAVLTLVSGDNQVGRAYSLLSHDVIVRVTDANGVPVAGQIVSGVTSDNIVNGWFVAPFYPSDAQGEVALHWVLGGRTLSSGQDASAVIPGTALSVNVHARAGFSWHKHDESWRNLPSVAAGRYHTCALVGDYEDAGAVFCWGRDNFAQLGDGWITDRAVPKLVTIVNPDGSQTPLMAEAIVAGAYHTCAIYIVTIWCWGENNVGQVGTGSLDQLVLRPQQVIGAPYFWQSITAGALHTCALTMAGDAYCWGWNANSQLGDNTTTNRPKPWLVAGGLNFVSLSAGNTHTCGIEAGTAHAYCWGSNLSGELGIGLSAQSAWIKATPTAVATVAGTTTPLGFVQINAGFSYTCGVSIMSGVRQLFCWGANESGQLGIGSNATSIAPTQVIPITPAGWARVDAGDHHTCGEQGSYTELYCWGLNASGQLGTGTTASANSPRDILRPDLGAFGGSSAGGDHTCATVYLEIGHLYCWGKNTYGQLGRSGAGSLKPTLVNPPPSP